MKHNFHKLVIYLAVTLFITQTKADEGDTEPTEEEPKGPALIDKSCLELSYNTVGPKVAPTFSNVDQLITEGFNEKMRMQALAMNFDTNNNLIGL